MDLLPSDMANPIDRLAHYLSECHNDRAPIGWQRYRTLASLLIEEFDLERKVMEANIK